jgi:DnaK suppressor protein
MFGDLRTLAAKRELTELAAIRRALVRLEGGTYGTCDHCGAEIPTERLKAQPAATCCPSCQSVRERTYP